MGEETQAPSKSQSPPWGQPAVGNAFIVAIALLPSRIRNI